VTRSIDQMIFPSPAKWNPVDVFTKARQETFTLPSGETWVGYVVQEANAPDWVPPPPPLLGPWPAPGNCSVCQQPIRYREAHWVAGYARPDLDPALYPNGIDAPADWVPERWHRRCNNTWPVNLTRPHQLRREKHVTNRAKKVKKQPAA